MGLITTLRPGQTTDGDDATVLRLFPGTAIDHIDPLVLLDDFRVDRPHGFPMHPHRGFEAVTYMLEGAFVHEDSAGNSARVEEGGVQRVTMGSGVRHSEQPGTDHCRGLQLWVNLPQDQKDAEPDFQVVAAGDLPEHRADDAVITTVIGDGSPLRTAADVEYLDVELDGSWHHGLGDRHGIIYCITGSCEIDGHRLEAGDGATIEDGLTVEGEGRFVVVTGTPLDQPIDQHGPYVD